MPAQVLNGPAVATHMYQALFGKAPSNALYNSYIAQIGTTDGAAFAASLTTGFATTTDAALATMVLANLGVTATTMPATAAVAGVTAVPAVAATATTPAVAAVAGVTAVAAVTSAQAYAALESALTQMFTGYGVSARGQIILNMTNLLANLEGDKTFGTIATTYNNQTLSNFTYASNAANTVPVAVTPVDPTTAAGQTYTLTTGIDNFTGTGSNDTFIADAAAVSPADSINGGAGTDTLKIYAPTVAVAAALPVLTSVENIYVNAAVTAALFNVSGNAGITSFQFDANAGAANTVTVTTGQAVVVSNNAITNTTTIAGNTPTALNVTLTNLGNTVGATQTVDFTGTALTTINITGATTKSTVALTETAGTAVNKLTVAGSVAVTLTEDATLSANVKTIDASTSTGGVSVNKIAGVAASTFAFTGGSGNDTLTLRAGDLAAIAAGTQINFGLGTDKLGIFDLTAALTTGVIAKINATGAEVIGLNAAQAIDASQLTVAKSFSLDTDAAQSVTNMATGSSVAITAAHGATFAAASAVGVADLGLTIGTATTTGLTNAGVVTIGQTAVALSSLGTNAASNTLILSNADNSTYTVTGNNNLTLTLKTTGATAIGSKVDGSAFTGKLTAVSNGAAFAAGSTKGDVLIGGSGADTLSAGANSTTLTGNAGNDTFDVALGVGGATAATAAITTVTDFTKGDILKLAAGNGTAVFTAAKVDLSGAASVAAALDLLSTADGSVNSAIKWGVYSGNTYVVEDNTAGAAFAATDVAVKLTGTLDLSTSTLATVSLTFA